ncbi:hypothetical protein [Cupriavidus neocaledonicus]|uniref:Lipoprotein n=1 Tax=Cupriavidus neocaledonicus TaxID=1040979 RepID=A0A375HAU3_9BURK|nr:hypothetical protein [Cupriavidus neocaledonicus]SOZ35579.1 putative lipoprotein [Cupriavidus neocaledonicus]SPD47563.1 conserved exported protein of unknown function [Cupriavidus neocaledonicus]
MLPRRLPTTLAAMLIAAALLAGCGGDGGPTLSPTATLAPSAEPVKPGQPGKPDQRPDPVIRCAP